MKVSKEKLISALITKRGKEDVENNHNHYIYNTYTKVIEFIENFADCDEMEDDLK